MGTATIYNSKTEFYGAMREIIDALRTEDNVCPFCRAPLHRTHDATCPLHRLRMVEEHYLAHLVDEPIEPRRECVMCIDRDRFRVMLTTGGRVTMYCDNLPDDAWIVGMDTAKSFDDFERNSPIRLVISSQAFDLVLPHERPILPSPTGYISQEPMGDMFDALQTLRAHLPHAAKE